MNRLPSLCMYVRFDENRQFLRPRNHKVFQYRHGFDPPAVSSR